MESVGIFEAKTHLANLRDEAGRGGEVSDMPVRDLQYLKVAKAYHLSPMTIDAIVIEAALRTGLLVLSERS